MHDDDRGVSFTCIHSAAVAAAAVAAAAVAAAAALCVAILLLFLRCCCFLLLFVVVCRMANFFAGSLNLIPAFFILLIQTRFFFMYPLAVLLSVAFTTSICPYRYIVGNYGHAQSQGGRQPVAAKPRL